MKNNPSPQPRWCAYFQKTCSKFLETNALCYVHSGKANSSSRSARWIPTEAGCHSGERSVCPQESAQFPILRAGVTRKSQSTRNCRFLLASSKPMGARPSKIIHVDYARGVLFTPLWGVGFTPLVSRKYAFDGDLQVLAPPQQVKIG